MSPSPLLRALQRQLRQERRHAGRTPVSDGPATNVVSRASTLLLPSMPFPMPAPKLPPAPATFDVAARLADVRVASPRLHASLATLDAAQLAAVLADDPAALVRAQVGSGKTTVLVHKVLYLHLVRGVPLEEMAVLTFTNRAADEIRTRIDDLGERATTPDERWLMGTFHGVARALLQRALPIAELGYRPDFAVLDEEERAALLTGLVRSHKLRLGSRRRLRDRLRALAEGGVRGTDRTGAASPAVGGAGDDLSRLAALAGDAKRARNAMDFDDLIDHALTLLDDAGRWPRPRWIVVDELQDCEPRELELLRRLRDEGTRFFGVGDPHQAIYGWRGGAPELFTRAESELGCRSYELPVSYRSTRTILDGARAVLGVQPTSGGALEGVRGPGARIVVRRHHDPVAEAIYLGARIADLETRGIPRGEIAVLCRLRAQAETLGRMLGERGTPCAAVDDDARDAVRLLTLHAAKGLEFRHVFIAGANLGILPLRLRGEIGNDAEERRLLFVGLTRARDDVEVSYHAHPHQFGAVGAPSPFLYLLPAALVDWQDGAPTGDVRAPAAVAAPDAAGDRWHAGQPVRHPRYGEGVVVRVADDTVDCDFGKRGPRSFPLGMCPLVATKRASVEGRAAD